MTRQPADTNVVGIKSEGNRTFTPLGANETFEGVFEDITNVAALTITIITDAESAPNGFKLQWSADGEDVDFEETLTVANFTGLFRTGGSISPKSDFFRIVWVNGPVAQTEFKIVVTYHSSGSGLTSRSLQSPLTDNNFALAVRAVLSARKSNGVYTSLSSTDDGILKVVLYGTDENGNLIPVKVPSNGRIKTDPSP